MWRGFIVFAVLLPVTAFAQPQQLPRALETDILTCQKPYIIDGDTFDCHGIRVRLSSIDTPEMPDHCRAGRHCVNGDPYAAKAYLQSIAQGEVTCTKVATDKYGRMVARCASRGIDLSCAMVHSGHAIERYGKLDCS